MSHDCSVVEDGTMALLIQPFHTFPDTLAFESNILPLQFLGVPFLQLLPLVISAQSYLKKQSRWDSSANGTLFSVTWGCPPEEGSNLPLSGTLSAPLCLCTWACVYPNPTVPSQWQAPTSLLPSQAPAAEPGAAGIHVTEVAGMVGVTGGNILLPHLSLRCLWCTDTEWVGWAAAVSKVKTTVDESGQEHEGYPVEAPSTLHRDSADDTPRRLLCTSHLPQTLAKCEDHRLLTSREGEFPGGPVVKTLHFPCWGPGFNPWWRN